MLTISVACLQLLQSISVPVFGPRNDGIAAVTHPLGEGDRVEVPGPGA
jgi:hydroxyacylglutathione hydrolase